MMEVSPMKSTVRARFWLEVGLASVGGFLAVLTLLRRDWIERLTGIHADPHDGAFEWAVVAALCVVCVVAAFVARTEWRRPLRAVAVGI